MSLCKTQVNVFRVKLVLTQVTKRNAVCDESLKAEFRETCEHLMGNTLQPIDCPLSLMEELFSEILSRVINTMMNSLLQCAAMVKRIESNKGVDADVALRDKLKVYASEKESCIRL